jgi:hypothetical protein
MAPVIQFQTALNRKTEEVSPAKEHVFVFRFKCYISNHSYKIMTNSVLHFGGTVSYLARTGYSDVVCYLPHGIVYISLSCSKDLWFEILNSTLSIILSGTRNKQPRPKSREKSNQKVTWVDGSPGLTVGFIWSICWAHNLPVPKRERTFHTLSRKVPVKRHVFCSKRETDEEHVKNRLSEVSPELLLVNSESSNVEWSYFSFWSMFVNLFYKYQLHM